MNAADMKQRYSLPVLGICPNYSSESPAALLTFSVEENGQRVNHALLTAAYTDFGLPGTLSISEAEQMPTGPFQLPHHLQPALQTLISTHVQPGTPIWIEFAEPSALLPILPWEQMLSGFGHPVLRLPPLALVPDTPSDGLDCVICFSSPPAEGYLPERLVHEFIQQIPQDLAQQVTFHVFAEAPLQALVHNACKRFESRFRIIIYDPLNAPDHLKQLRPGDNLENPWLRWMRSSLGSTSADVVHFLCHGFVRGGRGALSVADCPWPEGTYYAAGYIYSDELSSFLNDVGAWSVAFTSAPGNYSPAGLRLLQHEMAKSRPGPALLHDMLVPGESHLGMTYRFLYSAESRPYEPSPGITLYCHPHRTLAGSSTLDEASDRLLNQYTLRGRLRPMKQKKWVASSQRVLEQAALRVSNVSGEGREAAEDALKWVADVIARHASRDEPEGR